PPIVGPLGPFRPQGPFGPPSVQGPAGRTRGPWTEDGPPTHRRSSRSFSSSRSFRSAFGPGSGRSNPRTLDRGRTTHPSSVLQVLFVLKVLSVRLRSRVRQVEPEDLGPR